MFYGPRAVYDEKKGFTLYYSSHLNPEHLMCVAQLEQKQDMLFFYWRKYYAVNNQKYVLPLWNCTIYFIFYVTQTFIVRNCF